MECFADEFNNEKVLWNKSIVEQVYYPQIPGKKTQTWTLVSLSDHSVSIRYSCELEPDNSEDATGGDFHHVFLDSEYLPELVVALQEHIKSKEKS